jgi:thioredoxin 1
MPSDAIVHLTDESFEPTLATHAEPVVVDFWAEWCGPCKAIAPVLEELAKEYQGRVTIGKVNVDDHPALAARFQVRSIPTLLIFKAGQVVDQVVGAVPKSQIKKRLDAVT